MHQAVAESEAILQLTTKIPPVRKMRNRGAWEESNLLRTEGSRILVGAAIAQGVKVYVHESVTFVYADCGSKWVTEETATDDGESEVLRSALDGEKEAVRFSESGGEEIVLRFDSFYGTESNTTTEMISMTSRHQLVQLGPGSNFVLSIYIPDTGTAGLASLNLPSGTSNVVDDNPVRFKDYLH